MAETDSIIAAAADAVKQQIGDSEALLFEEMTQQWLVVERALQSQFAAAAKEVKALVDAGIPVPKHKLFQLERSRAMLAQLMDQMQDLAGSFGAVIEGRQLEMLELGWNASDELVRLAVLEAGDDTLFAGLAVLPDIPLEKLMGSLMDSEALGGLLLERFGEDADAVMDAMLEGVAKGLNPNDIARLMAVAMHRGLDQALGIARTETMRAYREAAVEAYRASGGMVVAQRRIAARDSRTCPACLFLDGTVYPLKEAIPEHPMGRCTSIPVFEGEEDATVPWKTGKDWFLEQDPAMQRDILGPGKFQAWQDGKIALDDLGQHTHSDKWGGGIKTASLKDLLEKGG